MPGWLIALAVRAFQTGWNIAASVDPNSDIKTAIAYINHLLVMIGDVVNTWVWSGYTQSRVWNLWLHPDVQVFHDTTLRAFGDVNASLNHIVDVIVPISVKTGTNRVWQGTGQLKKFTQRVENQLAQTVRELLNVQADNQREDRILTREWAPWYRWLQSPGRAYFNTLAVWIKAPPVLSAKLAPSMTVDVVNQLYQPAQIPLVDRLLALLAYRAVDLPAKYPKAASWADRAAVAILNSGRYPAE